MKILLISGHGNGDPGATATHDGVTYREADLTREVTAWLASALLQFCEVEIYPTDRNAYHDALNNYAAVSFRSYDYVLEVHFNAYQAGKRDGATKGTEIYVVNHKRKGALEQSLVDHVAACGLKNRGVKINPYKVISGIERLGTPAALLEVCFIDDPDDMAVYHKKFKDIIQGIVCALAVNLGLETEENMAKFKDVPPDAWYADAVSYVVEHGLMNGMDENTFDPNGAVTRAQLAAVTARLHKEATAQ